MNNKIHMIFKPLKKLQILTVLFSSLRTVTSLYLIYLTQQLIDAIIQGTSTTVYHVLSHIMLLTVVYLIVIFATQFFLRQLFFTGHFRMMQALYHHILKQPLTFFKENDEGHILSKITNDAQYVSSWYAQGIVIFITQIIVFTTTFILLATYHILIAIAMLVLTLLCFGLIKLLSKKIASFYEQDQQMNATINQSILQSFLGIFDIKQLHQESYFQNKVTDQLLNQRLKLNQRLASVFSLFVGTSAIVAFIVPIISVILSAQLVLHHQLTVGAIMAIFSLTKMLDEPIRTISDQINQRQVAYQTLERLKDILNAPKDDKSTELPTLNHLRVDIKDYPVQQRRLNITFEIRPQQVSVIKGQSGVGKTTITRLIQQIIPNDYISWNNINLSTIHTKTIFDHILSVNQQTFIFEGTVKENILFDQPTHPLFNEIVKVCCIDHLLDKQISSQGDNLSGGEKQRLHLARILIQCPPVLILDEVTSALNETLSDTIASNIINFAKKHQMAIIVISHKNDFDRFAHQLIKIE